MCERFDIDILKFFIENGANIHSEQEYIMMEAAKQGNTEAVKLLISYGADIHFGQDIIVIKTAKSGNVELLRH